MIILNLDLLTVHLDIGLSFIDANDIVVRIEVVQSGLGKANLRAVLRDHNVVFRVQLGHLDRRFAFVQAEFRIRQARRNHHRRAVVAKSKKDARR
jgi:hypothetical protein